MSDLKVLMMGGRRCGKTAILASMFYQATNGDIRRVFNTTDQSPQQKKNGETLETLIAKRRELEDRIKVGGNETFLVDKAPTPEYWDYILRLEIPGNERKKMDIQFRDCAGEIFERYLEKDMRNYIQSCDVFIVVVDTPFLMQGGIENEYANRIEEIANFIDNRRRPAQVFFVPVKCEKWVKENRIDDVSDAVERCYERVITSLLATDNVEVSIIPVETAGDIIFKEFRTPYILNDKENKCSRVYGDDTVVIMSDGKIHEIQPGDIVAEDPEGYFNVKAGIVRMSTWFSLWHQPRARYTPKNCEQLVVHILRYMFTKNILEYEDMNIIEKILKFILGTFYLDDMREALNQLRDLNLIKDNNEGIRILRSCFLPREVQTRPKEVNKN